MLDFVPQIFYLCSKFCLARINSTQKIFVIFQIISIN